MPISTPSFRALILIVLFPREAKGAGKRPLSTVDPGSIFRTVSRSEGAIPSPVFGGKAAPLPTNAWWENAVLAEDTSSAEGNIFQMPYVILAGAEGAHAMQPFDVGVGTQSFDKVEALVFSAVEAPTGPHTDSWDQMSLTLSWTMGATGGGMKVPLVRGSPYITAEYIDATPKLSTEQQLLPDDDGEFKVKVDGNAFVCDDATPFVGKVISFGLVQSDATWVVFSPPGVRWSCASEPFALVGLDPLPKGAIRAAIANSCTTGVRTHHCGNYPNGRDSSAYTALLEAHAGVYPVSSSIDYEVFENEGHVTWEWTTRQIDGHAAAPLLQLAYPVHKPLLSDDALNAVAGSSRQTPFHDIRGPPHPVLGGSWLLTYPLFPDVGLAAPRPVSEGLRAEMLKALRGPGGALWNGASPDCDFDLPQNYKLGVGDTYFAGKMIARLARLIVIADELGESNEPYFSEMVDRLTERIEVWLHRDAETPFVYDTSWGGLLSCGCTYDDCGGNCKPFCSNEKQPAERCPALTAPGMNFGNAFYNDHHFHYGYYVYSAAVAAKYAPSWETNWREQVLAIVRDYGNPSTEDASFPVARHKDWFLGISWAGGIPQAYANGRNQESTSEAINSYYAIYAYGASVDAPFASDLKDFGRLLTAMETHGADTYWHVRKSAGIYKEDLPEQVIGILWDHAVEHQTWFGGAPFIVSGIQLLPIVPVMENFLDKEWVEQDSAAYKHQCEEDPECAKGWSWPMCLEQAVFDPIASYVCVRALPEDAFDISNAASNGNSLTNSLHWIATRPESASLLFADGSNSFESGQELGTVPPYAKVSGDIGDMPPTTPALATTTSYVANLRLGNSEESDILNNLRIGIMKRFEMRHADEGNQKVLSARTGAFAMVVCGFSMAIAGLLAAKRHVAQCRFSLLNGGGQYEATQKYEQLLTEQSADTLAQEQL